MDLATTIVVLLVGAALVGWLAAARDGRALEAFGLGFLGYRSYGWPRGVQEEDTIHFDFTEHPRGDASGPSTPDIGPEAELIELNRAPQDVPVSRLN
jgi:hypothetical protein